MNYETTLQAVWDLAEHRHTHSPGRRYARPAGVWPPKPRVHLEGQSWADAQRREWLAFQSSQGRVPYRGEPVSHGNAWATLVDAN